MSNPIPTRLASSIYALTIGTFGILHFKYAEWMGASVPDYIPGEPK